MFNKIKNGWYIILYHDINWEDSIFTQYIGGTCAPNIFFEQIEMMESLGQFVNIEDGAKLLNRKQIDKPYFSIWFDDGLKGVYNHAYPILNHFNIKPATIRKHRSKQMKNTLPFHKVGGAIKYNIIECEKFMEQNRNAY